MADEIAAHWRGIYVERAVEELSWTEPVPLTSLALIEEADLPWDAAIVDVGGGASPLASELVGASYTDVTVADLSAEALELAKDKLGATADQVSWVVADARAHEFGRHFHLWHDRALFHFMFDRVDRDGYLGVLEQTLRPGGTMILATFGPEGPTQCSGLPVNRYDAESISQVLGADYELLSSQIHDHQTPSGRTSNTCMRA
jgi:ubiquinone/menaquinone biosynthesis C-methylase UbiE